MISAINFKRIIAIGIIIHVLISCFIIFFPSTLKNTFLHKIYSSYLIPGPFFSGDRITDTYYLTLRWKEKNSDWSEPKDPVRKNYQNFRSTSNPSLLYRNRLDRTLYQQIIFNKDSLKNTEFKEVFQLYYKSHYIPQMSDSIQAIFLRQRVKMFQMSMDTLQTFEF